MMNKSTCSGLMCGLHKCVWHWMISLRCLQYFASLSVCLSACRSVCLSVRAIRFSYLFFFLSLIWFLPALFFTRSTFTLHSHTSHKYYAIVYTHNWVHKYLTIWFHTSRVFMRSIQLTLYTCADWAELPQYFRYIGWITLLYCTVNIQMYGF